MKLTIDGTAYDFDPATMRNDEAILIERECQMTFKAWGELLTQGSITAMTALVWIVQRREDPSIAFGDVRFEFGSLDVEDDAVPPSLAE